MKKRLFSCILVFIMILSLTACDLGNGQSGDDVIDTQTESDQTESDEGESNQTESDQTESDQIESEQTESNQTESDKTGENDSESDQNQTEGNDSTNNAGSNTGSDDNSDNKGDSGNNGNSGGNTGSNDSGSSGSNTGSNSGSSSEGNTGSSNGSDSSSNTGSGSSSNSGSNTGSSDNTSSPVEPKYISSFTKEENDLADAVIAKIIKSSMGEFEKVKAIHDYLLVNVDYDYQNYLNGTIPNVSHTAKGALANRYAVCDGYSYAFQLLCLKVDVSCELVTGTSRNEPHAWNQVKIEGKWYNIDVTWDDPVAINDEVMAFDDHSGNSYEYFCVPDSILNKDHKADNAKHSCTSQSLYERALKAGVPWENAKYVASEAELMDWIKAEVNKGNTSPQFYIKASVIGDELGQYCMDAVQKAGIKISGVSLRCFTYFEGTTDPGTYNKITLTIKMR
jgi:transglutaminase/protease-like cytokinesis protein 3